MRQFNWGISWAFLAVAGLAVAPFAHAEDMETLSAPSLRFLDHLVPEDAEDSPRELLTWYELMQTRKEQESAGRHDATLDTRIRQLQSRVSNYLRRDELMMWYAPGQYLQSLRNARHRQYVVRYGWMPATTLGQLVGHEAYSRNLRDMDFGGLRRASLREEGWSETFWPDLTGSIAAPYADPNITLNFVNFLFYGQNRSYLNARPAVHERIARGDFRPEDSERLSAAEKYDLLVGDLDFTFTNRVLRMVEQINADGQMATWSGVCDGWSSASLNFFRPERAVEITGARGHHLKFYTSDIKGLASFLWAKSFDRSGLNLTFGAGYQCKDSTRDMLGRSLDPTCNDVNPGFFHAAAVNMIGIDRHGFVFDKSEASTVMNQPAFKYEYKYFRVTNGLETDRMDVAKVPLSRLGDRDPYKAYRSPRAVDVVGVKMKVWFKKEHAQPRARTVDPVSADANHSVDLTYDLELDARGNIVGGEWRFHRNLVNSLADSHPDTLWLVVPGIRMYSRISEFEMPAWAAHDPIPEALLPFAKQAALTMKPPFGPNDLVQHDVYRPQPLALIVDNLVELSRPGRTQHEISRIPGRYRSSFSWLSDADWARPDAP